MNRLLPLFGLVLLAGTVAAQPAYDNVEAGRFDNGRMFTLDEAPLDYFQEAYNFSPDDDWFEHARLGALRFATYCSASFVSEDGLILTNHHCARQSVTQVGVESGVDFVADGFYAQGTDEERPVEGLFVEQLVAIQDVTNEVAGAAMNVEGDAERAQARQAASTAAQERIGAEYGDGYRVQIVTLYAGGQYKAYVYKRYDDIRLVFAPELQLGYFGGDPDNFTYPRYSLDFALFRAYDDDGEPLEVEHFFRFQPEGTAPGDLVFIIGNPGSTTRLQTVAELEYRRDFNEPIILNAIASRERVYEAFLAAYPDDPSAPELTDTYFSLGNSRKAYTGRVEGLRDPYIIARRRAAERDFQAALAARADLQETYGSLIDEIGANREAMRPMGNQFGAFIGFGPGSALSSSAMQRAVLAFQYANATDDEQRAAIRENLLQVEDQPVALQQGLIEARLSDFVNYLGDDSPVVQQVLGTRTPAAAARAIAQNSALTTADAAEALLESGEVMSDPAVQVVAAVLPALQEFQQTNAASGAALGELSSKLARARFELYGTSIPPDATFTLRISDGVVKGYDYNGTIAPPYTTTFGLYDHYYSYCESGQWDDPCPWALPQRWMDALEAEAIDLTTPFNFVSTNDIIGGNSGSPMLNRDLEVIGIAFDGNIQSLPGNYIFIDDQNRTVSVDVRIMLESLEEVYDMDHIARELRNGGM